jgi:hypothetical protein
MQSSPYRDGGIPYALKRSSRARYARIEVDAEGVRVIVPERMPLREVAPFVAGKQRWIERTLRRYRQAEVEAPRVELVDGGSVPYLGRSLTLRVRVEPGRVRPRVARRGERLLLTERGREFVRTLEPETRAYRALLYSNPLYRAALAWIHRQGLDLVTYADVASFLKEDFGPLLAANGAKGAEEGVVCFFHLCQAAELGTLTIGKRGQPARMRVERDCLGEYVEGRDVDRGAARGREEEGEPASEDEEFGAPPSGTCLFISYGGQPAHVVAQIQTVFELAGIGSHASERAPSGGGAMLVADEAAEVMRRCDAALVLLSTEDCRPDESGAPAVSQRALVEIGAASVLYERRVLLLLDAPAELPAGLSSLPHVTLGEGSLTLEVGIELLKAVRGFASRAG